MRRRKRTLTVPQECAHVATEARHIGYYADGRDTPECDRDGILTGRWLCNVKVTCMSCGESMTAILNLPEAIK